MNLEMKCPHCDQWISSISKSCSECDLPLVESKEDANPLAPSKKAYGKLATGLIGVSLLAFAFFNYLKQDATEDDDQAAPANRVITVKHSSFLELPDFSEQLGYYGQWDKNKDGHLSGGEITETMTAINKLESQIADVNGSTRNFRWRLPQDIDLDNKLSRSDFLHDARSPISFAGVYDLNGDNHLDEKEIEAFGEKTHLADDLMAFDINQDNLVDLLEIPPTHLVMLSRELRRGPRERQSGIDWSRLPKQLRDRFDTDKDGKLSDSEKRKVSEGIVASRRRQGGGEQARGRAVRPSPRVSATGGPGVKGGGNKGGPRGAK